MDWDDIDNNSDFDGAVKLSQKFGDVYTELINSYNDGKSVPAIIPDDYADGNLGLKRKENNLSGSVIPLMPNGPQYVRLHYGVKTQDMSLNLIKYIYWIVHTLAGKYEKDMGLKKGAPVEIYVSGSGLHPYPKDIKAAGLEGGGNISVNKFIGGDPLKVMAHELSHVMMGPFVDRSNALEESLAEFFSNLYNPSDDDLYTNMLNVGCKMSFKNLWSKMMLSYDRGQAYALEPFWYFVVCRYGLDIFLHMIFRDMIFYNQEKVENVWKTIATYLKIDVTDLVIQYVKDTLFCNYFRDNGIRFKCARQKLSPYYGEKLVWKQYNLLTSYDILDNNSFIGKRGIELYGFEVHSLPVLFKNSGLASCGKIEVMSMNIDDKFSVLLLKRRKQKVFLAEMESQTICFNVEDKLNKSVDVTDISLLMVVIRLGGSAVSAKYKITLGV